jgi:thioredoxin-like negative regulator of GroEL
VIEMLLQADRLLTVDMIDQADAIYRRVAEQDPRNAIAVVGMARCALARGEDEEAYRLASLALDIDPENDMARRMTTRMAEVLAYRAEASRATAMVATPTPTPTDAAAEMAPETAGPSAPTAAAPTAPVTAGSPPARSSTAPVSPSVPSTSASRSWLDRIRGR